MRGKFFAIGWALSLVGCAPSTFSDRPATLHFAPALKVSPASSAGAEIDPNATSSGLSLTETGSIQYYRRLKTRDERRNYRDSIVWQQLAADDDNFNIFVRNVRSDRALMNMSADGGVIFLNGLAAVTGTAGEKAALSTLSAGLLGSRGSVDKELFNLETMSAIIARMKAARKQALVPIRAGLARGDGVYPLEQALVDLRSYADAGSLLSTIAAITNDAGVATETAEQEIAHEVRGEAFLNSLPAREAISERMEQLKGNQLTALAFALEPQRRGLPADLQDELKRVDPSEARFRDAARAKIFFDTWLADDESAGGAEWDEAVTLAEKAKS